MCWSGKYREAIQKIGHSLGIVRIKNAFRQPIKIKENPQKTARALHCTKNDRNRPSESDNDQDIFKLFKLPFDFGFVNIITVYDARGSV